jgi:hypothetical protein
LWWLGLSNPFEAHSETALAERSMNTMTRPQQIGLLIVLLVFIVYVCIRLR